MDLKQEAIKKFSKDRYAIKTTGVIIEEVDIGYAKCSLEIGNGHMNIYDNVMGAAMYTLADCTFGVAATAGNNSNPVTLGSSINFMRATKGPRITAEAKCVKDGHSICFYEITISDSSGAVVATVSVNGYKTNRPSRD